MAISKVTQSSNTGTTGTTIDVPSGAGTISVNAGDIVFCHVAADPGTGTVTFSKQSGTATISSFSTQVNQLGSAAKSFTSWCVVTGTGTLQIRATRNGTPVSTTHEVVAYRGASGVGQSTSSTGSSGTDITLSLTTQHNNSWCILLACSEATTTALTGGTNTTVEQAAQINVSGTANDLSSAVGSNESALSKGTNEALHFTQPNGKTWSAVMYELVQQFDKQASAGVAASETNVASSIKAVSGTVHGEASKVASSVKAASAAIAAASVQLVTQYATGSVGVSAAAVEQVLTNFTTGAAGLVAVSTLVASSVRAADAGIAALQALVASSVTTGAAGTAGSSAQVITHQAFGASADVSASEANLASSVVAGSADVASTKEIIASSVHAAIASIQASSALVASSVKAAAADIGALSQQDTGTQCHASAAVAAEAVAQVLTNLSAAAAALQALSAEVASSNKPSSSGSGASATVVASSVKPASAGIGCVAIVSVGGAFGTVGIGAVASMHVHNPYFLPPVVEAVPRREVEETPGRSSVEPGTTVRVETPIKPFPFKVPTREQMS